MEAIQPCPHCSHQADVVTVNHKTAYRDRYAYFIYCDNCGHSTKTAYPSMANIIGLWNTQALQLQQA
jgi:transcription elongation factor Elf1